MKRRVAWLGLCLGLSSTALAESAAAPIRVVVPSEIPSDGVLPIFGTCVNSSCSNLQPVTVVDMSSGERVDGRTEVLRNTWGYVDGIYFVPNVPFRSDAAYNVTVPERYPGGITYRVWVSAAPQGGLDESAVRATEELSKYVQSLERRCCSPNDCIDVNSIYTVGLSATLIPERPIATQYVYEVSMHAQSEAAGPVVSDFRPLHINTSRFATSFDGASDSYCYTVRARPIVGGEPFKLMTRCVANDFTDLGPQVRSPEEVARWAAACLPSSVPVDAGAPSTVLVDASTDGDGEPLRPIPDITAHGDESGCQLAAGGTQGASTPWWPLGLVALALARSGRRNVQGHRRPSRRGDT